ncbi:MAG: hypothetical protein IPL46_15185 [Saprospiraceae bacterium]|nr:hypothetical protein [Saprospiraceae bacterium]
MRLSRHRGSYHVAIPDIRNGVFSLSRQLPCRDVAMDAIIRKLLSAECCGTRTSDMVRLAHDNKEPEFDQADHFRVLLNRPSTHQVTGKHPASTPQVINLIKVLNGEMSREELQGALGLSDLENFCVKYLKPALEANLLELTFPASPRHPNQKYRLTDLGKHIKNEMLS